MSQTPDVHQSDPIPDAAIDEVERLLRSGDLFRYTAPADSPVARLESAFAEEMGTRYALAVASCSAALFLTLKSLDLPTKARVLIPAFTFAAVPSSVIHAECKPVLCEVTDTYRLDRDDFMRRIVGCDAVLISHMRGHTSDMDMIMEAAAEQGIPVIEDAAHSMGTLWDGRRIGTLGAAGCFSFQSYKMLNAGEGGLLVTDDADIMARAIIMSGAYEHNWRKHPGVDDDLTAALERWQNKLPLYNTRLSNLSAAVILPQIPLIAQRARDGARNHDRMAERLSAEAFFSVPPALPKERRAPDSIQFNLRGFTDAQTADFVDGLKARHLGAQVFGMAKDNARAFWNWEFLGPQPELPQTRAMLMRACDVRLPARLSLGEVDLIADAIIDTAREALGRQGSRAA
ncbi:MAG: DegT/DnrJ/EryC1/StrS family aminotransferase [Shimia sp.]